MQIPSALFGRAADLDYVLESAAHGACVSVVAVSNLGKSALLRAICDPAKSSARAATFVYVDCNRMPERTGRAFYTNIWHALLLRLDSSNLRIKAQRFYDEIVDAPDALAASLHFGQALELALEHLLHPLVLCLDEFDEAYQNLEQQTFLNLRALRDQYREALVYVIATSRELARLTTTREQGEFYELIVPRVRFMHLMEPEETRARYCRAFAAHEHVTFSADDLAFIASRADGHPGLVQAVCFALGAVTGSPVRNAQQDRLIHKHVQENLSADINVQTECQKIWNDLEQDEREALLRIHRSSNSTPADERARESLRAKSIVLDGDEGPCLFSPLFDDYVRQIKIVTLPDKHGVYIDVDAGDVWVDGKSIEPLTDLEYRLLLFLYGRMDRVCDKYAIVEAVWGEEYIDKVDDTRIEKLVSRLRQKIEHDPAHPRYLSSLRGRGYKLVR